MKSTFPKLLLICFGLGLTGASTAAPQPLDRIVAVVNNAVITEFQLRRKLDETLRQLAGRKTPLPPRAQLEKQMLERMITEKVLVQLAEETGVRIDAASLDRAVARVAQQNKLQLPEFKAALRSEGVDFEVFREQVRADMTLARLREREVDGKVQVTDAEIDNLIASQGGGSATEYRIAHILIAAPEGASPEQLQTLHDKAERALTELNGGTDFAQVSAAYSDTQNALEGGDLGWRGGANLPTLYLDALKTMQPGQVSPVLRSAGGFHLIKLFEARGKDVALVVRQTRARHILIKSSEIVSDQEAQRRLDNLRERIRHGDDFAKLAKLHSDDLSASKGGDLGWLNPGDTVPQFERVMDALQPNEVSAPVQSPFGWHLIQVLERREQDVTEERRRLDARRALRERKAEEAFEDWVRQARDRAYVELHLEE
jgi:peptidyl-prolyl cis-trans isomerase SurA